jgi:hypothetical protein
VVALAFDSSLHLTPQGGGELPQNLDLLRAHPLM